MRMPLTIYYQSCMKICFNGIVLLVYFVANEDVIAANEDEIHSIH